MKNSFWIILTLFFCNILEGGCCCSRPKYRKECDDPDSDLSSQSATHQKFLDDLNLLSVQGNIRVQLKYSHSFPVNKIAEDIINDIKTGLPAVIDLAVWRFEFVMKSLYATLLPIQLLRLSMDSLSREHNSILGDLIENYEGSISCRLRSLSNSSKSKNSRSNKHVSAGAN